MSTVEELGKTADGIAGSGASSLRSPEAQASYFIDKAQVEATIENTKAIKELTKSVDTMTMGLIGELMSLKETLTTCLTQDKSTPDYPLATIDAVEADTKKANREKIIKK